MISRTLAAVAAILTLAGGAAVAQPTGGAAGTKPTDLTVQMSELNKSGETGTAVVSQVADGVKVVVDLKGAPKDAQPTHIHIGTCDKLKAAPEYPLVNTVDGKGETVVKGVTLDQLTKGKYAINVHKSTTDLATYVSCGEITASKSM